MEEDTGGRAASSLDEAVQFESCGPVFFLGDVVDSVLDAPAPDDSECVEEIEPEPVETVCRARDLGNGTAGEKRGQHQQAGGPQPRPPAVGQPSGTRNGRGDGQHPAGRRVAEARQGESRPAVIARSHDEDQQIGDELRSLQLQAPHVAPLQPECDDRPAEYEQQRELDEPRPDSRAGTPRTEYGHRRTKREDRRGVPQMIGHRTGRDSQSMVGQPRDSPK